MLKVLLPIASGDVYETVEIRISCDSFMERLRVGLYFLISVTDFLYT